MSAHIDATELDALAVDIGEASKEMQKNAVKAIEVGARDIKDDWRGAARGMSGRHAKQYPSKITYDLEQFGDGVVAEIGPVKSGQGNLGAILEYAGGDVRNGPQNASRLALRANLDSILRGLAKAGTDPLGE